MSLQNRVDPYGDIHAVPARGMFTGNRGVVHDPATKTLLRRRWTSKAWIICSCQYKGRRREPMGLNGRKGGAGWTELFFLDEVTALASGHRPCFTCRRDAAKAYAAAFGEVFGVMKPTVQMMDARLHAERLASAPGATPLSCSAMDTLPDGTMVSDGETAYALRNGHALPWSFDGYGAAIDLTALDLERLRLVTPATTVEVLKHGYEPVWHGSAGHARAKQA